MNTTGAREEKLSRNAMEKTPPETSGDEFIAELSHSHGPQLLQYLGHMLGKIEVAREVAQEAYKQIRRRYRAEDVMFPKALLYKIATTLALIRLRGGTAEVSIVTPPAKECVPEEVALPNRRAMAEGVNEKLVQEIKKLRPRLRQVLVMAHVEGIARQNIAEQLGISLKRVDKRMTKAMRRLRERMESHGIELLRVD